MAQTEVGPNDIVIHLVNPYKCGDCGSEFCLRSLFLEHLEQHLEKLKTETPCHQIVCGTVLVEQQPNGITVTRDILQINENQMFELQDPSLDYTQLSPLRALEQAGILSLPPPRQSQKPTYSKSVLKEISGVISIDHEGIISNEGRKVSRLQNSILSPKQDNSALHVELVNTSEDQIVGASQITIQQVQGGDSQLAELESLVHHAVFGDDQIKEEYNVTIENPAQHDGSHSFTDGIVVTGLHDRAVIKAAPGGKSREKILCPICGHEFANRSILERHQVVHTGLKPYSCTTCLKQFNDVSSLRQHSMIHKRQFRCPICHRMYLRKLQLMSHMKQHDKKRFIQFGSNIHEVHVSVTRNADGQLVHEYSLMILLEKQNKEKEVSHSDDGVEKSSKANIENESVPSLESTASGDMLDMVVSGPEEAWADEESAPSNVDQEKSETEKKRKVIYQCGHCKKLIFARSTLSRHLIKHTNTRPFQCDMCLKTFRDKADLFHHHKTHTKPIQCKTCSSSFSKPLFLHKHLMTGCPANDNDTRFTVLPDFRCHCNICQKILKNKANILRHLRVHAFQERHKKDQADGDPTLPSEALESSGILELSQIVEDHFKALVNSVGYHCQICGQEFRFKSFMITHIRMHLNQRPYKCQECSKSFFARHMLKKHQHNHTKPYKCPCCNKGFIRRYLMKDHYSKKHEKEEPLKDITEHLDKKLIECDICGKIMKSYQKSLMLSHIRLHKDVRPFKCKVCHKSFISEHALKKHFLNHTKPYKCQVCHKGFSRRYLLTDHFKNKCFRKRVEKFTILEGMRLPYPGSAEENLSEKIDEETATQPAVKREPYKAKVITEEDNIKGCMNYICEPCDKKFIVYDNLLRHLNTFAKPTACKYCKSVFEDKHLSLAHQRSCLGMPVNVVQLDKSKRLGEQQVKVQKIVKEIREKIEAITTSSSPEVANSRQEIPMKVNVIVTEPGAALGPGSPSASKLCSEPENISRSVNSFPFNKAKHVWKEEKGKFQCPECHRSFSTPRGLKIHTSSHVRLFKCDECSKDFTQLTSLRAHVKMHMAEVENEEPKAQHDIKGEVANLSGKARDLPERTGEPASCKSDAKDKGNTVRPKSDSSRIKKRKRENIAADNQDSDDDRISELKLGHSDLEAVSHRLMLSGTRGRPYSCKMCRRRFTEQLLLDTHMKQKHGVEHSVT